MKEILLTEEHKAKLLEMCNKLFPEQNKISFGDNHLNYMDDSFAPEIIIFNTYARKDGKIISHKESSLHWFEFCHTELAEKIFFTPPQRDSKEKYLEFCWECNLHWDSINSFKAAHPVDYLYEQFKKL